MGGGGPAWTSHGSIVCRHALECHASRTKFHMIGGGDAKVESRWAPCSPPHPSHHTRPFPRGAHTFSSDPWDQSKPFLGWAGGPDGTAAQQKTRRCRRRRHRAMVAEQAARRLMNAGQREPANYAGISNLSNRFATPHVVKYGCSVQTNSQTSPRIWPNVQEGVTHRRSWNILTARGRPC